MSHNASRSGFAADTSADSNVDARLSSASTASTTTGDDIDGDITLGMDSDDDSISVTAPEPRRLKRTSRNDCSAADRTAESDTLLAAASTADAMTDADRFVLSDITNVAPNKKVAETTKPYFVTEITAAATPDPAKAVDDTDTDTMSDAASASAAAVATPVDKRFSPIANRSRIVAAYTVHPLMTTDMCDDQYVALSALELRHRYYCPTAGYVNFRRQVVDWIFECAERIELRVGTIHIAIRIFDAICSITPVHHSKLLLMAIGAIILAAKYDEDMIAVPTINVMLILSENVFSDSDVRATEIFILKALDWTLPIPTAVDFQHYYERVGILSAADRTHGGSHNIETVLRYVKRYNDFFIELTTQPHEFTAFLPSVLAAACIGATRRAVQIVPEWNDSLSQLTRRNSEQIMPVVDAIWRYYVQTYPERQTNNMNITSATVLYPLKWNA